MKNVGAWRKQIVIQNSKKEVGKDKFVNDGNGRREYNVEIQRISRFDWWGNWIHYKRNFPYTRCVNNIERDKESNQISCDIYIMEEYPEFGDTLDLSLNGIDTHDFGLTSKELLKWRQFLLAKGCDYRLKDNPYMEE